MPTQKIRRQFFSGMPGPLVGLQQEPIVMDRVPTTADAAEIGTEWVYPAGNAVYFLSSETSAGGVPSYNWASVSGGAGVFTSLTVTPGNVLLAPTGANTVIIGSATETGAISIGVATGAQNINIANVGGSTPTVNIAAAAGASNITLGNTTAATAVAISAGATGGIALNSGGNVLMGEVTATAASPTATVVINQRVGHAVFTGFTTAAAGSQVFTITNAVATANSSMIVTSANLGGNDAQMTQTRLFKAAGSFQVTLTNNGAAALNGDVHIDFWIFN